MQRWEQAKGAFENLNAELKSDGDVARVRYVSVEPDFEYDDGWIILATWELPALDDAQWPLEQLDGYRRRTYAAVGDIATVHCLFRTPEELSEPGHQRGEQLQPA